MNKISIYQVFTRLFGNTKSKVVENGSLQQNGVGKMSDFTARALKSIKKLGITHVWYTGIIEHATCTSYPEHKIQQQNPKVVKGRAGSPYAITDYYDVNPYLADDVPNRINEFKQLIDRTHKNGLKVIIDFVPNHVARQYHSDIYPDKDFGLNDDSSKAFSPDNDFYYIPNEPLHLANEMGTKWEQSTEEEYNENPAKATGNDQFHAYPTVNDWYETVKLNYGIDYNDGGKKYFDPTPLLWNKMVDILEYWCSMGIDGIRCDMAEMVPVEFWNYAINRVKSSFQDVIFIAEVYNPAEYHNYLNIGCFDYLYDKVGLYDCLRNIICYDTPAYDITKCWQNLDGIDSQMLRFLENHDEQRIGSEFFADNPEYALPAMVVSATLNTGPVMTYFGQEVGEPAKGKAGFSGDDGRTTIFDFYIAPEHQKWMNGGKFNEKLLSEKQINLRNYYSQLLNFSINSSAIVQGKFYDLMWGNNFEGGPDTRFIYSYLRYHENEKLLIVINFDKQYTQNFKLKIPEHAVGEMGLDLNSTIKLVNNFSGFEINNVKLAKVLNEGIELELKPLESFLFTIVY